MTDTFNEVFESIRAQNYTKLKDEHDHYDRQRLALYGLIRERVAEFAGAPRAQMIAGAHVTGNCAICGRGLTDPISVEKGIGPECFGHLAPSLRAYLDRKEEATA